MPQQKSDQDQVLLNYIATLEEDKKELQLAVKNHKTKVVKIDVGKPFKAFYRWISDFMPMLMGLGVLFGAYVVVNGIELNRPTGNFYLEDSHYRNHSSQTFVSAYQIYHEYDWGIDRVIWEKVMPRSERVELQEFLPKLQEIRTKWKESPWDQ